MQEKIVSLYIKYIIFKLNQKDYGYLFNRSPKTLLTKIDNETTVLDKILDQINEQNEQIFYCFPQDTIDNIEIIKIFIKHNFFNGLEFINTKTALTEIDNDKTVLDILLTKSNIRMFEYIDKKNPEIIKIFIRCKRFQILPSTITEELALLKIDNDNTVLDCILNEKKIKQRRKLPKANNAAIAFIYLKHQQYERLSYCSVELLLTKIDNETTIVDEILKNDHEQKTKFTFETLNNIEIIKKILKYQKYNYLSQLHPNTILTKIDEHNTLLDIILEQVDDIKLPYINVNALCIKMSIIKHNRISDFAPYYSEDTLLTQVDEENKIIDILLKDKKFILNYKKSFNIINIARRNPKIAQFFIKHNHIRYLSEATDSVLTSQINGKKILDYVIDHIEYNLPYEEQKINLVDGTYCKTLLLERIPSQRNMTLLEILLKINKDKTLKKIIEQQLDRDIEILTILKLNKIDISEIYEDAGKIEFEVPRKEVYEFSEVYYEQWYEGILSRKHKEKIGELRQLFLEDGNSDIEIIDLACKAFSYQLLREVPYAIRDLELLINIKINNPKLCLKKSNSKNLFNYQTNILYISNQFDINIFHHELTHVFHYYITKYEVPRKLEELNFEINDQNYKNYKKFISHYLLEKEEIRRKYKGTISELLKKQLPNQTEIKKYVDCFSNIIENLRNDYPPELLEYIEQTTLIEDEYYRYFKKIRKEEIITEMEICILNDLESIIDIIDGLTSGKIYDDGIMSKNGLLKIGHGSKYYSESERNPFDEIIASYLQIIKSPTAAESIKILESIIGQEIITMLDAFYESLSTQPIEKLRHR